MNHIPIISLEEALRYLPSSSHGFIAIDRDSYILVDPEATMGAEVRGNFVEFFGGTVAQHIAMIRGLEAVRAMANVDPAEFRRMAVVIDAACNALAALLRTPNLSTLAIHSTMSEDALVASREWSFRYA